ncbi:MAG: phosphoribosyltransferase family protein [Candidatus Omnitrophota bacterium]
MYFENREDAGRRLAELLVEHKGPNTVVYALPRGGVMVAKEIAARLASPMDLVIPRKVCHPEQSEYAVCAVAEDGHVMCDEDTEASLPKAWLSAAIERELNEAQRRREVYLEGRKPISASGKTAIIVDDGVATGLTLLMALFEIKHQKPAKIVAAVPVVPADVAAKIKRDSYELIALDIPVVYKGAVGRYYREFNQVDDSQVVEIMRMAHSYTGRKNVL